MNHVHSRIHIRICHHECVAKAELFKVRVHPWFICLCQKLFGICFNEAQASATTVRDITVSRDKLDYVGSFIYDYNTKCRETNVSMMRLSRPYLKGEVSWPFPLIIIPLLRYTKIDLCCAFFQTHIGFSYSISVNYVYSLNFTICL